MLLSRGYYWPCHCRPHISWPLEIPTNRNILTPAPSITGNLMCLRGRERQWVPPHVYASKYVSVFTSGRSSSCSPCGPLGVWKSKGLKAEDAKQIYLLASWSTVKTEIQIEYLKRKCHSWCSVASPLSVSSSISVELFWESLATRRLSKSILYL